MYMRVALTIHKDDVSAALETYHALSKHIYTHATPVMLNAGTECRAFGSCFLYVPEGETPFQRLEAAPDMDRFWVSDGGIGMSLCRIPCKRRVIYL